MQAVPQMLGHLRQDRRGRFRVEGPTIQGAGMIESREMTLEAALRELELAKALTERDHP